MKKEIGNRVRINRKNANLTQEELAERADVSTSFISRLENGRVLPGIEGLNTIAAALNVGLQDLLCDLFTEPADSDPVLGEIMYNLKLLSASDKVYILEYVKLFMQHYGQRRS